MELVAAVPDCWAAVERRAAEKRWVAVETLAALARRVVVEGPKST